MNEINTMSDWMNELSNAIDSRDFRRIDWLENVTRDWMQSDDGKNSQLKLLQSVSELLEEVDSLEGDLEALEEG